MDKLNLPDFETLTICENGTTKIFDPLRMKYVALTPEEWVRQHFINHLILHLIIRLYKKTYITHQLME